MITSQTILRPQTNLLFNDEDLQILKSTDINFKCIGIDASINSTGVALVELQSSPTHGAVITTKFFAITPNSIETTDFVQNIAYSKMFHKLRSNTELEHNKLLNYQSIANVVQSIISENKDAALQIGIEGIAYAAGRGGFGNKFKSKSSNIYDLAALNAIIRDRATYNNNGNVVISIPPKTNKAHFVHGNATKIDMLNKFCDELCISKIKPTNNNGYLFDVADAYAIARHCMFTYFGDNFVPRYKK